MSHIADFMVEGNVGLNNYIARELSPHSMETSAHATPQGTPTEEKEKFVWRMHQPAEPRKFTLFPVKDKLSITPGGSRTVELDPEPKVLEKTTAPSLRGKPSRRKVSIPGLETMTTVQEIAMDSPTIPGRPPLHERSISAPGNHSWRQHAFGESMLSCISGPAFDENAEILAALEASNLINDENTTTNPKSQPLSPKILAPLIIPMSMSAQPRLASKSSRSRLRTGSLPPDVPPKSGRPTDYSPHPRASPYTPYTPYSASSLSLSMTNSTAPTSVNNTPLSALPSASLEPVISAPDGRPSPRAFTLGPLPKPPTHNPISAPDGRASPKPWSAGPAPSAPLPQPTQSRSRGQSEATLPPMQKSASTLGHRRTESEASIMDRGRPKKRSPTPTPTLDGQSFTPLSASASASPMKLKRKPSVRTIDEQKAFETLPTGVLATATPSALPSSEIEALRRQAIGQACRFEVLSSKDVDALSRELRQLDERCEYLRKTHRSLRAGRRNLHDRICTYLRSPRVARFSHESILKQEEALSELDTSIDDWVSKLEQAENRRTRVRQKLLEHVAAALIMPGSTEAAMATSRRVTDTPPRSPTKQRSEERFESPVRLAAPVQVSSPDPAMRKRAGTGDSYAGRPSGESIRIYADCDISALLRDVDEEITRMADETAYYMPEEKEKKDEKPVVLKEIVASPQIMLSAMTFQG